VCLLTTPWQSASARCSRTVAPATGPAREVQKRASRCALGIGGFLSTATVGTPATSGNPS
jgi:hypothetical protein